MAALWRRRTNKVANHLEKVSTDFISLAGKQECDTPPGCLLYSAPASGNFNASMLVSNVSVKAQLKAWNVPSGMWNAFELAALTSSADFQTFDFTLNPHVALFQAHVGTLRRDKTGKVFLGYVYADASGNLLTPLQRYIKPGVCLTKNRAYTGAEMLRIRGGLSALAFTAAAKQAGGERGECPCNAPPCTADKCIKDNCNKFEPTDPKYVTCVVTCAKECPG